MLENMVQVFLLGNRKYPNYEEKYCPEFFLALLLRILKGQASRILYY
jgi:hypothetical protein